MSTKPNTTQQSENTTQHITPSQRAAVVIAMLGETAAKPIVEMLDDQAIANIAASLESITVLAREQLIEIVIDFLRQLRMNSGSLRGGSESARKILEGVLDEPRLNLVYGGQMMDEDIPVEAPKLDNLSDIWAELAKRETSKTAAYLAGLTPNIIALILRNLETTLCSELICLLNEDVQTKVLGEMVDPPPASPDIDSVIARMVKMEYLQAAETVDADDTTQLQSVGEMLSLVPNERRKSLMGFLEQSHSEKVDPIQRGMFAIEDLPKILNRNQIPVLFKAMDQAFLMEVLCCLQAQYGDVAEYFLSNISNRMADQFRSELERMSAPDQAAAELTEKNFLTKMMELKRDGVITVERIKEEAAGE
nr:FliG C-terminal domain-containing protein [Hyphomonas sp. Mor2]